jgi:hypothetical protein
LQTSSLEAARLDTATEMGGRDAQSPSGTNLSAIGHARPRRMMTEVEQAQRFIRLLKAMTPKQKSVLAQAVEDFNADKCTFEELKVRTADCRPC